MNTKEMLDELSIEDFTRLEGKEFASVYYNAQTLVLALEHMLTTGCEDARVLDAFSKACQIRDDAREHVPAEFLPFTETDVKGEYGEMDIYPDITTQSVINSDGELEGPTWSNGFGYFQNHVDKRAYDRENEGRVRNEVEGDEVDDPLSDFIKPHIRKPIYDVAVYRRKIKGEVKWCDNVRILMNPNDMKMPLFVNNTWRPHEKTATFEQRITTEINEIYTDEVPITLTLRQMVPIRPYKVTRSTKWVVVNKVIGTRLVSRKRRGKLSYIHSDGSKTPLTRTIEYLHTSGIPFKGSAQLAPEPGCAYSNNPLYSIVGFGAEMLKKAFLSRAANGSVNECQYVERNEGAPAIKKRQVWCIMEVPIGKDKIKHKVLVFSDLRK